MPQIALSEANDADNAQRLRARRGRKSETAQDRAHAVQQIPPPPEATCRPRKSSRAGRPCPRLRRCSCVLNRLVAFDCHCQRPLGRPDKVDNLANQRIAGIFLRNPLDAPTKLAFAKKQGLIRRAHALNVGLCRTPPPQADHIEPNQIGERAMRHTKRDDVGTYTAQANDHCAFTDTDELTNCNATTKDNMIADRYVPTENCIVGKNDVASNLAVVPDVRADHEETPVANFGDATIVLGAGAHGYVFADVAFSAHNQPRRPSTVTERLRRRPE